MMINPNDIEISNNYLVLKSLLKCNICNGIVIEPYQCKKCDKLFCKKCLKNKKCINTNCNGDTKLNETIKDIISNLVIKCKNGCGELIPYDKYIEHIELKCSKIDYQKGFCVLKEKQIELKANEIQLNKIIKKLKMNKVNYTIETVSHFSNLIRKHKRCKVEEYEIREIENNIADSLSYFHNQMNIDCYE